MLWNLISILAILGDIPGPYHAHTLVLGASTSWSDRTNEVRGTFFFALAETRLRGQVSNRRLKSTNTATRKPVQKEGLVAYNPLPTDFPPMATGCWAAFKFVQGQSGTRYNPPARPVQLQRRSGRNILPTPPHHRPKHPHT